MERKEEIEMYRDLISKIIGAFSGVPFPIIVETATRTKVEPFNIESDKRDQELVHELSKLADIVMHVFYKNPIKKSRPNEVSNYIEEKIEEIYNKNKNKFKIITELKYFGRVGYPDEVITDTYKRTIYLEIKATQKPDEGSARNFYFTPLEETKKKITKSGKHCLLGFIIAGKPNNFRTIGWKLIDLAKIKVNLKPEFNANNKELYRKENILAENYIKDVDK